MGKIFVEDTNLVAVADVIRAKTETTEPLTFPSGFMNAIEGIQVGGDLDSFLKGFVEKTSMELILPNNVTKIRDNAFYDYGTLKVQILPDGITSIGKCAFKNCYGVSLTSLPSALVTLGNESFYQCNKLALTTLPSGLTRISDDTFYYCSELALTSLPSSLTYIGHRAFNLCEKITVSMIPGGVTYVGRNAFYGCHGITSITFQGKPSGGIASDAFEWCENLTTINVPWAVGEVANAPWGASKATINYNYTGE